MGLSRSPVYSRWCASRRLGSVTSASVRKWMVFLPRLTAELVETMSRFPLK